MSLSERQWDQVYNQKGMAQYPDNMLIRFVAKNYYNVPNRKDVKFLDVGCGAGASSWYLAREGFSVAAIDSSPVAMENMRKRFEKENLEAFMMCGDVVNLEFKPNYFDGIVDISSLCYIPQDKITGLMSRLYTVLKPGGRFFSISPTNDCAIEPFNHTINKVSLRARFMTYPEAYDNFKEFKEIKISTYTYQVDRVDGRVKLWVIQAEK